MPNIKKKEKHCIWILEILKQTKFNRGCWQQATNIINSINKHHQWGYVVNVSLKSNHTVLYYKVANLEPSESETEILSILECVE